MISRAYNYLRTSMYNHPIIVTSYVLGGAGVVLGLVVYPIRREMGYTYPIGVPKSFPMPSGPRVPTPGFEDPSS